VLILRLTLVGILAALWLPAHANGSIEKGKLVYVQQCAVCHSTDYNGIGPLHSGVFGRKAGTAPGFAYSPALKTSAVVWGNDSLSQWLADPEKLIPGQKMWVKVEDAGQRQDLVAYLKSLVKSK
jgi:cytochrome c